MTRKQRERDEDLKVIAAGLIRVFRSPDTDAETLLGACELFLKLFGNGGRL
jgi:hypothetical protein